MKKKTTKKVTETKKIENEDIKQTEIVVLLDRSGSMRKIADATVDGFNTFLNEQKNSEGEAFITLIQFDDRYEVDYKSIPVKEAHDLVVNETYVPRGNTALYESIGRTIQELNTDRDEVFVIITDGHDNVRSEFKPEAINKMISTLQEENKWHFLFLAANQDAIVSGSKLGVKMSNSMSYATTGSGVANTFQAMSSNIGKYRSMKSKFMTSNPGVFTLDAELSGSLDFAPEQRLSSMTETKVTENKEIINKITETITKLNNNGKKQD